MGDEGYGQSSAPFRDFESYECIQTPMCVAKRLENNQYVSVLVMVIAVPAHKYMQWKMNDTVGFEVKLFIDYYFNPYWYERLLGDVMSKDGKILIQVEVGKRTFYGTS